MRGKGRTGMRIARHSLTSEEKTWRAPSKAWLRRRSGNGGSVTAAASGMGDEPTAQYVNTAMTATSADRSLTQPMPSLPVTHAHSAHAPQCGDRTAPKLCCKSTLVRHLQAAAT